MSADATTQELSENPLWVQDGYPQFDRVDPQHIAPAVKQLLAESGEKLEALDTKLAEVDEPNWDDVMRPLEEVGEPFERTWQPVTHLFGVKNSPELRTAYEEVLPEVVDFGLKVKQSEPIYRALTSISERPDYAQLPEAQRRIIEARLKDAELAGVGLAGEKRERFNAIARELSQLGTQFSNHVLDATKAWSLTMTDPADAEGLPDSLRQMAAAAFNEDRPDDAAEATAEDGPWKITLEAPSFVPFMQHCRNRALRQRVYLAFVTRASEGELDNTPLCRRILELRKEQSELLGYRSYAEVSLSQKMADSPAAVREMLETLRDASWDAAHGDMQEIQELALAGGQLDPLVHWDVAFWAERQRERKFDFTEEELRPYFVHEKVLDGLFSIVHRLFDISVVPADGEAPVWNKDVRFFKLLNADGEPIAAFYYDPYSRPKDKRGGAWMDDCLTRRRRENGELQIPVAHLVCNCTPPVGDRPSLMTFREVETLFHEFGHGLQHMLTTVDYPEAAGINNVEWDAVELPSQFMENWCYHRPTVMGMTGHYKTGEPLPEELFEKIKAARSFRAGSNMLRQLTFGFTDMALHDEFDPTGEESIFDVQQRIMERTSVLPMLPEDRFLCGFQHIFAGGYAAGYYSYKWAEVLSADAFEAFEEAGLDNEEAVAETGRRFRDTILARGGSQHPMDLFKEFRGREPSPHALLRQHGLL